MPGPLSGTDPAHGHAPVNALGPSRAADPAKAAASAPLFELARTTQTPGASDPVTGPAGAAGTPSGSTDSTQPVPATVTVPAAAAQLAGAPVPALVALPGMVALPGTAAAGSAATEPAATEPAAAVTAAATPAAATPAAAAPASATPAAAAPASAAAGPAGAAPADAAPTHAATAAAEPAAARNQPGTHPLHRRSARGPAVPEDALHGQPAVSGEKVAETAPIATGVPAEPPAVTAQGGSVAASAGDPSVPAVHAPAAAPSPAGHSTALGSETVHHHPAQELPLARQVAGPVLALRAGGDGSHQLIVALHPAELGPVNVHVRIVGDLMTIQLASTSETAHDALREALPQLRSELQTAGLSSSSVSVDLASGGSAGSGAGAFANPRQGAAEPSRPAAAIPAVEPALRHRGTESRTSTYTSAGLDRWL